MVFEDLCVLVLRPKVVSALEGLISRKDKKGPASVTVLSAHCTNFGINHKFQNNLNER